MVLAQEHKNEAAFEELRKLVHWLHEEWVAYQAMFGHSAERVAMLNQRTGLVFEHIDTAFFDSIMLGITKAIDGDKRTISLRRAIAKLCKAPANSTKEVRTQLSNRKRKLLERHADLRRVCTPILQHRDQRIAHHESKVALGETNLPPVSRNMIREAMNLLADLFHDIAVERDGIGAGFYGAELDMEPSCHALFNVLRAGNHFLDQKDQEIRNLLKRAGSGEIIENLEAKLAELRKWFHD